MRNYWIRLGCFLTGYNFMIVRGCSERTVRRVLRYTSALIIICLLWAFIGFTFSSRYLGADILFSLLGLLIMVIVVIQIERQIILSSGKSRFPFVLRMVIGFAMALIGSLIIDQIIFKEDIEQQRLLSMGTKVDQVLPERAAELRRQIHERDSSILYKESERSTLVNDISRNPTISVYTRQTRTQRGQIADSLMQEEVTKTSSQIQNPKMDLIKPIDDQIASLRKEKSEKELKLLGLRDVVEADLRKQTGFLDELNLMIEIISNSSAAMITWLVWFVFLLGLEVFILVSKFGEGTTDYDAMMDLQMELHLKRIDLLRKQ